MGLENPNLVNGRLADSMNATLRRVGSTIRVIENLGGFQKDFSDLPPEQIFELATNSLFTREQRQEAFVALQEKLRGNPDVLDPEAVRSQREQWLTRGASLFGTQESRESAREVLGMLRELKVDKPESAAKPKRRKKAPKDPLIARLEERWKGVLNNLFSSADDRQNAREALGFLKEQESPP
jgi:hypothetical protein